MGGKMSKKLKPYPVWVCDKCALDASEGEKPISLSTYHAGICDVCTKNKAVTEPRDFGYPKFKGHEA